MRRTTIDRGAEIHGLQSEMTNLQGEMVDLLKKIHELEGGKNMNSSSSASAGVCTKSLANTGLNKHSQPSQSNKRPFH
jgi:hypothetical protein